MLRKTYSLKLAIALSLYPLFSFAQTENNSDKKEETPAYVTPYGNLQNMSKEDQKKARELGESVANELLKAYETKQTPEMGQFNQRMRKRADDIADAALAKDRDKILEFLGIDPDGDSTLYYFVSFSMPLEMLRSYAIEAMWSGGALIFKGVPPGKDLVKFITEDLQSLVYGKGAAANISIDPRLFDAYEITTVPSIVFTTERATMQCQGIKEVPVKVGEVEGVYDVCPPLNPDKYAKITGTVSTTYALDTFIDGGMEKAIPFRKALASGFATGTKPSKEQKGFSGNWENALSPSQIKAAQELSNTLLSDPSLKNKKD